MNDILSRAREFIFVHGRLLERRIFQARFEHASKEHVERAVGAYQNRDGGFGHALEPDLRCPNSQPIFVEVGLAALEDVNKRSPGLAEAACGYLRSVSGSKVLVPAILEEALHHPHAGHWKASFWRAPSLNPSLGLCGLLHFHGVSDDWLSNLSEVCIEQLTANMPTEAHTLRGAVRFATHLSDRPKAAQLLQVIAEALPQAEYFIPDAPVRSYGLTPLDFAPRPEAPMREAFSTMVIDSHLDDLLQRQQSDGGWPITWEAPGPAAECEWRAIRTLDAVSTLAAYGILPHTA